jgi:hypothetical protein
MAADLKPAGQASASVKVHPALSSMLAIADFQLTALLRMQRRES